MELSIDVTRNERMRVTRAWQLRKTICEVAECGAACDSDDPESSYSDPRACV
jgi:hypothetical protein